MIGFSDFYNLATSSHAGIYEVDADKNLWFGKNRNEETGRTRVYDALLQSLEGDPELSVRPEVRKVVAELSALKEANAPVIARDVRKWQRQIQSYISFGAECVAGIPVKEGAGAPINSNPELSSALAALEWEKKSMPNGSDEDVVQAYRGHLELAYERFSRNCKNTVPERYQGDYSTLVMALSGKLVTGTRLGKDSADLKKDYEELVKILGEYKSGTAALSHDIHRQEFAPEEAKANDKNDSGLSREVLGRASEAIDIFMVANGGNNSLIMKGIF